MLISQYSIARVGIGYNLFISFAISNRKTAVSLILNFGCQNINVHDLNKTTHYHLILPQSSRHQSRPNLLNAHPKRKIIKNVRQLAGLLHM